MNAVGKLYTQKRQGTASAYTSPESQQVWLKLFNADKNILFRFAAMTPGYINAVLNSNLSPQQKFYAIFGRPVSSRLNGLGNIFEDIGGWFSNTFSQGNLHNIENWIREGSVTAQNIANALNYYTNAPTSNQIANQQQQLQTIQSSVLSQGSNIWQTYGSVITAIAVGAAVILLIKK